MLDKINKIANVLVIATIVTSIGACFPSVRETVANMEGSTYGLCIFGLLFGGIFALSPFILSTRV